MRERGIVFMSGIRLLWYRYAKRPCYGLSNMNYRCIKGRDQSQLLM